MAMQSGSRERAAAEQDAGFAAHPQPRVLLVAADAAVRDATRLLLRTGGYEVLAVATVAEALENQYAHVDALVSDHCCRYTAPRIGQHDEDSRDE